MKVFFMTVYLAGWIIRIFAIAFFGDLSGSQLQSSSVWVFGKCFSVCNLSPAGLYRTFQFTLEKNLHNQA